MRRGFTLIELLVSVTIIAIITAIGLVIYTEAQKGVRDSTRKQDLRSIQTALEVYFQKNSRFPCTDSGVFAEGTPVEWQKSTDSDPWLKDLGCGTEAISFSDISFLPKDPKNSGSPWNADQYAYAYFSGDVSSSSGRGCPKGKAQYYVLVTKLEKDNDPDRSAAKPYYFCDGQTELIGMPEIIPGKEIEQLFFITSQD